MEEDEKSPNKLSSEEGSHRYDVIITTTSVLIMRSKMVSFCTVFAYFTFMDLAIPMTAPATRCP